MTKKSIRTEKVAIDSGPVLTTVIGMLTSTQRSLRTLTVGTLIGALALPSSTALAAPPPDTSEIAESAPQEPDPAIAASRVLFEQGLDAYDAEDYATAARLWTEAHAQMRDVPSTSDGRRILGFDLAQAQMRAYALDGDPARLAAAKPLLETFIAWVDRPRHTMNEDERQDRQRAIELLAQINEHAEEETAEPAPAPRLVSPSPAPAPPPPAHSPDGKGLLIGGGVALAGGIAAVATTFVSIRAGQAAEDELVAAQWVNDEAAIDAANRDGRRANIGMIISASSALVLGSAGIAMLAVGARRRHRHISASAAVTPNSAGATMTLRF